MNNEEAYVLVPAHIAVNLQTVLKIAAERGAFKLEEYGQIAALNSEFMEVLRNNVVQDPSTAPSAVTVTTEPTETKE